MNAPWLDETWQSLLGTLNAGRLGHALLIHGPAGLGKRDLANRLVTRLLCLQAADDGCGSCPSCRMMATVPEPGDDAERAPMAGDTHPDLVTVAPPEGTAAQIKIEPIRELIHRIALTPSLGPHRAARIFSAGRMNVNAANALLKTLEEPPPGAWLVLVSDRPARLPATIRSRCVPVAVHPPGAQVAIDWLQSESEASRPEDRSRLADALALAGGAPLTALDWLDNGGLEVGENVLTGLEDSKAAPLQLAEQWAENADQTWRWLARWCQAALKLRLTGGVNSEAALARLASMPAGLLQERYAAACEGLRLSATPVRQDLLLADWLMHWRERQ